MSDYDDWPLGFSVQTTRNGDIYRLQEETMVTRASGSQSTKTVPKQGQNKPVAGGKAGAGDARGTAKLPTISRTSTKTTR